MELSNKMSSFVPYDKYIKNKNIFKHSCESI